MKKLSIFLLAAFAMISCGSSYNAKKVNLSNETDSINYAVGLQRSANQDVFPLQRQQRRNRSGVH